MLKEYCIMVITELMFVLLLEATIRRPPLEGLMHDMIATL
jgi:hypothetical protein